MQTKLSDVFGTLDDRARMVQGDAPSDRISVRDFVVSAEIGAFSEERGISQRLRFNVVLEVADHTAATDDDVDKILSYDTLVAAITTELEAERINLLETLADRIAVRCLDDPRAQRVFVRVEKLDRIPGALGVEVARHRQGAESTLAPDEILTPTVIFLSNDTLAMPHLRDWIDLAADGRGPVVLCLPPLPEFKTETVGWPARRIGLLSMEQNAWALAARDARCQVVATRTELDHAMKGHQLCVWAPSKLVLDSVERPSTGPEDPVALTLWLADQLQAVRVLLVGASVPAQKSGRPVLHIAADAVYDGKL